MRTDFAFYFGQKIKTKREDMGMSIRHLGKITGISHTHLGKIESGSVNSIDIEKFVLICNTLGFGIYETMEECEILQTKPEETIGIF